jgi:hypothetical protein
MKDKDLSPAFELLLKFVKERERNLAEDTKDHGKMSSLRP